MATSPAWSLLASFLVRASTRTTPLGREGSKAFTVQKTDLGPQKGIWYRVIAGTASAAQGAMELGHVITPAAPYTKIVSLEDSSRKGVHLASAKTMESAKQSIKTLQKMYPEALRDIPFSIVHKDLGEKGAWHRVVAGDFSGDEQARKARDRKSVV